MIRLRPGLARRLIEVDAADDVGGDDHVPWGLDRLAAHVNHGIHALEQPIDSRGVGEIGAHILLVRRQLANLAAARQPDDLGTADKPGAQHLAKAAGSTGEQQSLH